MDREGGCGKLELQKLADETRPKSQSALSAGNQQMEQDRASLILLYTKELGAANRW